MQFAVTAPAAQLCDCKEPGGFPRLVAVVNAPNVSSAIAECFRRYPDLRECDLSAIDTNSDAGRTILRYEAGFYRGGLDDLLASARKEDESPTVIDEAEYDEMKSRGML